MITHWMRAAHFKLRIWHFTSLTWEWLQTQALHFRLSDLVLIINFPTACEIFIKLFIPWPVSYPRRSWVCTLPSRFPTDYHTITVRGITIKCFYEPDTYTVCKIIHMYSERTLSPVTSEWLRKRSNTSILVRLEKLLLQTAHLCRIRWKRE